MHRIADYPGRMLNHVECLYRPGERELAIELAQALGCTLSDTGFSDGGDSFLAIHPDPDDRDVRNNAFYISEMTPAHRAIEDALRQQVEQSPAMQSMLRDYHALARSRPFGVPHFGMRYRSIADVEEAIGAVEERLVARLGARVHARIYRPGDADAAGGGSIQAFVHQDVIVSGSFLYGQVIELQKQD